MLIFQLCTSILWRLVNKRAVNDRSKHAHAVKLSPIGLYSSAKAAHHTWSPVPIGWISQRFQMALENIASALQRDQILDVLFSFNQKPSCYVVLGLVWFDNTCSKSICDLLWLINVWWSYKLKRGLRVLGIAWYPETTLLWDIFSYLRYKGICYVWCLKDHIFK